MALGSLKEVIADTTRHRLPWPTRIKIATHVASGMARREILPPPIFRPRDVYPLGCPLELPPCPLTFDVYWSHARMSHARRVPGSPDHVYKKLMVAWSRRLGHSLACVADLHTLGIVYGNFDIIF